MEIGLTDDQQLFVDTTRRFLEAESPLVAVRALAEDPVGYDPQYWRKGAELGWTSLLASEELGGGSISGGGLADLVLVAEEIGRHVAPGPLLSVSVVVEAVSRAGAPGDLRGVLDRLVAGEAVAAWALAESDTRWDGDGVSTRAVRSGADWELSGAKAFVQDGASADWFLVAARTDGGLTQLMVPSDAPGVTVSPLVSLDMVRRFADVAFDGVRVPASWVVGEADGAAAAVERQLTTALAVQNAETVGAAGRLFELTLEYSMDRVSFGRPIGSYQAIKHRLADMKLWLEACFGTATAAARAAQDGAPEAAELASVAKAYIADRCPAIAQDCVQLHGGIGVTWEADLHLYLRRITQNAALFGTVAQHRERLAGMLGL